MIGNLCRVFYFENLPHADILAKNDMATVKRHDHIWSAAVLLMLVC